MVAWELGEPESQRDWEGDHSITSGNQRNQPAPIQGTIKPVLLLVVLVGKTVNAVGRDEGTPNAPTEKQEHTHCVNTHRCRHQKIRRESQDVLDPVVEGLG